MREEAERLRNELYKLDQQRAEERNRKLVGKCFKYRNSYSAPSAGWWLYAKVNRVEGSFCEAMQFEKTELGEFQIYPAKLFTSADNWQEIPFGEFVSEWKSFLAEINEL